MYRSTLAAFVLLCGSHSAYAEETITLTINNHKFEPRTITVKAGVKIALSITNASKDRAEFESAELNRERVIAPGATIVVYVGPLEPGTYPFFDDYDQANTGQIIVK